MNEDVAEGSFDRSKPRMKLALLLPDIHTDHPWRNSIIYKFVMSPVKPWTPRATRTFQGWIRQMRFECNLTCSFVIKGVN